MSAKHTKGKWLISSYPGTEHSHCIHCNEHTVALCVDKYNYPEGYSVEIGEEEAEANAKLIVAAPDLLEALKTMVFEFGGSNEGSALHAIKKAKQAIKSTGQ